MTETNYWTRPAGQRISRRGLLRSGALLGAGVAGAALIGCGDDEDTSTPTATAAAGGGGTTATGTAVATGTPAAPAAGEPRRGGTITSLKSREPLSFDPYLTLTWASILYASPVFSQLVRVNRYASYPLTPDDLIPDLAESWEFNGDGSEMTFHLREGVKWHNGTPFTSADAKYSIERMAAPDVSYFAGDFVALEKVETPDDHTAVVTWKGPSAGRLAAFGTGYSVVLSEAFHPDKDRKLEEFAMGTGPFILADYNTGQDYTYERNPDYYEEGLPYIDKLVQQVVSTQAALPALMSGQGDYTTFTGYGLSNAETAATVESGGKDLVVWKDLRNPLPLGRGVHFNVESPGPWQSVDVRRALGLVVDQDAIPVSRGLDWTTPSDWFLPGMGLEHDEVRSLMGWDQPMDARVTEAKALMARAGFADGFSAQALVRSSISDYVDSLTLSTESWRTHLGVDVTLDAQDTALETQRRGRHDYQMVFYISSMRTGMHPVELGSQFVTGAPESWSGLSMPELDKTFDEMAATLDTGELVELTKKAQTILFTEMPGIPSHFNWGFPLTSARMKGVAGQPWLTNEDLSGVWVEEDA